MKLTQKLLGFLNRAFSRDPVQFLAMRLRYDGTMTWAVEDAVLTTTVAGGTGAPLVVDLTLYTLAELANHLSAQPGYTVVYRASGEASLVGARTLMGGSSDQDTSNGDHLYAFTSLTWAYLDANAVELKTAREQIFQMLRQMVVPTAENEWLDDLGGYYNVPRNNGETDALYGPRIVYEVIRPRNNNKAIEIAISAISVATGGLPSKVTDVTENGSMAPLYSGAINFNGAYLYNASGTRRRNLFDVECAFDLEGSEDTAPFRARVLELIDRFRAAGTHMRSILLTSGVLSDTVGFSATDVFEHSAELTVADSAALPTDDGLAHSGTVTMDDSASGAVEGAEELASLSQHLYNGAHYYGGSGRVINYDSGALVIDLAPSLRLDFMNGSMPPEVTFTRASGGGRFNSSGVFEWVGNNVPRLDYDPVTLRPLGLLNEEARMNLLSYSNIFSDPSWTVRNCSFGIGPAIAPDGAPAYRLIENSSNSPHIIAKTVTFTAGQKACEKIYALPAGRDWIYIGGLGRSPNEVEGYAWVNLSTLAFSASSGDISVLSVRKLASGWCEIAVSMSAATTSTSREFRVGVTSANGIQSYQGDGVSGVYLWCAQLEVGSFSTSPIPTAASPVTRAADVAKLNTLTPWFSATDGTWLAEVASIASYAAYPRLLSGDSSGQGIIAATSVNGVETWNGSVGLNATAGIAKAYRRAVVGYSPAGRALVLSGGSVTSDANLMQTVSSSVQLGANGNGSTMMTGYIREVAYWNKRLANELMALISAA